MNRLTFSPEEDDEDDPQPTTEHGVKLYGTPFPPLEGGENAPRKMVLSRDLDLTVRDEQGRRRFHGAFTGGFSAGYYNTVGSKEGWTPSQFVSSRENKWSKDLIKQKPEDFMDEEDFTVHGIAPKKVKTTDKFTNDPLAELFSQPSTSKGPIEDFLRGVIRPTKMTIGERILKKMKATSRVLMEELEKMKKELQELKKREPKPKKRKAFGCSLPPGLEGMFDLDDEDEDEEETGNDDYDQDNESDNDDIVHQELNKIETIESYQLPYVVKSDKHGLGYKGMLNPVTIESSTSAPLTASVGGKKLVIAGDAFGTGVLEDGDDEVNVYDTDDLHKYDFELRLKTPKAPKLASWSSGTLYDRFSKESSVQTQMSDLKKKYPPPKIPRDWKHKPPFPLAKESKRELEEPSSSRKKSRWDVKESTESKAGPSKPIKPKVLDANVRALMMGDKAVSIPKVSSSSISFNRDDQPSSSKEKTDESPLESQPPKKAPLFGFFASKFTHSSSSYSSSHEESTTTVKLDPGLTPSSQLTVQVDKDKARQSQIRQEDISLIGTRCRVVGTWRPSKLLCKRFNIPQPD